jgi:hypothetical protein
MGLSLINSECALKVMASNGPEFPFGVDATALGASNFSHLSAIAEIENR